MYEQIFIPGYNIINLHKLTNYLEPNNKVKIKLER